MDRGGNRARASTNPGWMGTRLDPKKSGSSVSLSSLKKKNSDDDDDDDNANDNYPMYGLEFSQPKSLNTSPMPSRKTYPQSPKSDTKHHIGSPQTDETSHTQEDIYKVIGLLEAKRDMGFISDAEFNHMVSLHRVANAITPAKDDARCPPTTQPHGKPTTKPPGDNNSHLEEGTFVIVPSENPFSNKDPTVQSTPPKDFNEFERRIFEMSEGDRVQRMQMVRDGVMDVDGAVDSIERGTVTTATTDIDSRPFMMAHEDIQSAAQTTLTTGTFPDWLSRGMLRDELIHVLDKSNDVSVALELLKSQRVSQMSELREEVATLKHQLSETQTAMDAYHASSTEFENRVTVAESTAAESKADMEGTRNKLTTMEKFVDEHKKEHTSVRVSLTQAEFQLQSMKLRNGDLNASLREAEMTRDKYKRELDAFDYIREALAKAGVDLETLDVDKHDEKLKDMLAKVAKSAALKALDDSNILEAIEEAVNDLATRKDSPLDVLVRFMESDGCHNLFHYLAEFGMLGPTIKEMDEEKNLDRAIERICAALTTKEVKGTLGTLFIAVGTTDPSEQLIDLFKSKGFQANVVALSKSGMLGSSVKALANSGHVAAGLELIRNSNFDRNGALRWLQQLETLSTNGTLEMVIQFTGVDSPIGRAAAGAQRLVSNPKMKETLHQLIKSQGLSRAIQSAGNLRRALKTGFKTQQEGKEENDLPKETSFGNDNTNNSSSNNTNNNNDDDDDTNNINNNDNNNNNNTNNNNTITDDVDHTHVKLTTESQPPPTATVPSFATTTTTSPPPPTTATNTTAPLDDDDNVNFDYALEDYTANALAALYGIDHTTTNNNNDNDEDEDEDEHPVVSEYPDVF